MTPLYSSSLLYEIFSHLFPFNNSILFFRTQPKCFPRQHFCSVPTKLVRCSFSMPSWNSSPAFITAFSFYCNCPSASQLSTPLPQRPSFILQSCFQQVFSNPQVSASTSHVFYYSSNRYNLAHVLGKNQGRNDVSFTCVLFHGQQRNSRLTSPRGVRGIRQQAWKSQSDTT